MNWRLRICLSCSQLLWKVVQLNFIFFVCATLAWIVREARRKMLNETHLLQQNHSAKWSHVWLSYSASLKGMRKTGRVEERESCQTWYLYKRKIKLSNLSFVSRKSLLSRDCEILHLKEIRWRNRCNGMCSLKGKFMHIKHFSQPNQ